MRFICGYPKEKVVIEDRKFVCFFHFVGWSEISLGMSISLRQPNIELHLPFGFIRIGWQGITTYFSEESFEREQERLWMNKK